MSYFTLSVIVVWLASWGRACLNRLVKTLLRPATTSMLLSALNDLSRSRTDLMAENALLRHQLTVLKRKSTRSTFTPSDRLKLLLLARWTKTWRQALFIVQPATLLRWHREGFQLLWRFKSRKPRRQPRIATETITLIHQMADENPLWGAERIRGELLKLGIHISKRTIQRHLGQSATPRGGRQTWAAFLKTHVKDIWACDFVPVIDLCFRQLYVFFVIELQSRRVIHFNVTRHPTQFWVAQQLREATPDGHAPKYIIRDNDSKYGRALDEMAVHSGITVLHTPIKAPRANGLCERFVGSVRRDCLDHLLIFGERQLYRVIKAYVNYFNCARPHQGIAQRVPEGGSTNTTSATTGKVISFPVLNGLHHEYRRAASQFACG